MEEPFLVVVRKLNGLGVRYMVSGSVAAIARMSAATGDSWEVGLLEAKPREYSLEPEWRQVLALVEQDHG